MSCVRPGSKEKRAGSVAARISEATDWDRLLELAAHHRVRGPLYRGLSSLCPDRVPSRVRTSLKATARAAELKNKFLVDEMGRVQSLLADEGVKSIAFKGPVLAYMVYRDGRYRYTHDIDLVVHPEAFARAATLLTRDEYRSFPGRSTSVLDRLGVYLNQQAAFTRGRSFAVDLHASLTPIVHASGAQFDTLWDRSAQRTVEGACVQVLHPVDRLLMLCQQGIKNRWNRLKYIADLVECLHATDGLDWETLWDEARRTCQARLLLANLLIAHELFQVSLPESLYAEIEHDRRAERIGTWGLNKLRSGESSVGVTIPERMWLYWTVQDTVSHSVHYAGYSLVRNLWEQAQHVRSALRGS